MTTYNTGNPVGSTDARDLYDNAQNLDTAMNSTGSTWTDRRGVVRKTFKAAENAADDAEAAANTAINTSIPAQVARVTADANTAINTEIPAEVARVIADANTSIEEILEAKSISTTAATSASASASSAQTSKNAAEAAAEASGNVLFYDTYAAASAALGGMAVNQVVEVFSDETKSGLRTRYRKESGSLVFKMYLHKAADFYVDSIGGDNANDGLTPDTPKKTLAAAVALLKPGATLYLARGSRWFERPQIVTAHVKVRPYGNGNRPIIDGSLLVSGTWTQHGTYANLWYIDVTFPEATVGNYTTGFPGAWHPALFDEGAATRPDEAAATRVLKDDVVNGSTVTAATISDLLAVTNSTPGAFTVHKTGSTNTEPRSDNGTQFRFYFYPADGTNPNTNGRSVYVVDQAITARFGPNNSVQDLVIQRTGGKDMAQMEYASDVTMSDFTRVDFLDAAVHATVVGGVEFRSCRAKAARHGDSLRAGGGCYHQYTEVATKGFKIFDCESDGFGIAVYSHGTGAAYNEHVTFDIDGLKAYNCNIIIHPGSVAKGVRARRIFARNVTTIVNSGAAGDVVLEDSKFVNVSGHIAVVTRKNLNVTLRRCFVYKDPNSTRLEMLDPFTLGTILASEYPTMIMEDSTVIGNIQDPGNAPRRQQNWRLTNSILHKIDAIETGQWMLGTLVATNSFIGTTAQTLDMLRAQKPGVDATCLTQVVTQTFRKTFEAADITYYNSTRTGTYSGTPNGDGTATITINYNNADWSRQIRFVDAYGAGLHYDGYIVSLGTMGSSQAITVYPAPTGAFTSKTLANGTSNFRIFGPTMEVTGTLDRDGAKIEVPDGDFFTAGMYIYVGAMSSRQSPFGVRKVSSVSGNILTLDRACAWQTPLAVTADWFDQLGSITTRGQLPTVSVTFGFPLLGRNGSGTGITYPKLTITPLTPSGVGAAVSTLPSTTFGRFVGDAATTAIGMGASAFARNYDGVTESYGSIDYAKGVFYQGIGAAVGDVVKLEISAIVDDWAPQFSDDVLTSGNAALKPGSELAIRGLGYKRIYL